MTDSKKAYLDREINKKEERGSALVEYILIVALVAVASIAILTIFGDQIRAIFSASSKQLSGDSSAQVEAQGDPDSEINKGLNNF